VAVPPPTVRRTASRASGADSTAATERFSAWAWSSRCWVEDWTTPSATAAATAAAATAAASRGSQGLRASRSRAGGGCCTSGGSCRVTEAAVRTRSRSPGGGLAATARASLVEVSRKPRTSFSHGGHWRR
jgi:hypothetical protein